MSLDQPTEQLHRGDSPKPLGDLPCASCRTRRPGRRRQASSNVLDKTPMSNGPGLAVIYRFRLHAGAEETFVAAWSRITQVLQAERGGLGSRLHRGPEGVWYAYAQWPSAEARSAAFALGPIDAEAERRMANAVAEQFPEIVLEPVADFLAPGPYAGNSITHQGKPNAHDA